MTRKQRRLALIGSALAVLALAVGLVLNALRDSIVFFATPSEVATRFAPGQRFRLGGLVEPGSLKKGGQLVVTFSITDGKATTPVNYRGILPDLFREGQGVVAHGKLQGGKFVADEILAKHDEKYMPPQVAKSLEGKPTVEGDAAACAKLGRS